MTMVEDSNVDCLVNRKLSFSGLLLLNNRLIQQSHNCCHCTNLPTNLTLHPYFPCEQDPKIFKLHLRQEFSSDLKGASHHDLVENHGLELGGAEMYPSWFTLGCKLPQTMLKVPAQRSQKDTSSVKSSNGNPVSSEP